MDAIIAVYTADTGSGGLNNSSANAYLRGRMLSDDDSVRARPLVNFPTVLVSVNLQNIDGFARGGYVATVTMRCLFDRDMAAAKQNAVMSRLYEKYHRVRLTASSSWTFGTMAFDSNVENEPTDKIVTRVVRSRLTLCTVSGGA